MPQNIEPNFAGRWPSSKTTLHVSALDEQCQSLGPGTRAVVWLQGCCFRCPGCIAPEKLPFKGGQRLSVRSLAAKFIAMEEIDGVTFSGGEPFMQATALTSLINQVKRHRDLSFMSYTGFTLDEIRGNAEPAQLELLSRLDLLIDGRYLRDQHTTLQWRGSSNQKVHFLSDRYTDLRNSVNRMTILLDMVVDEDGSFYGVGIFPKGFQQALQRGMNSSGVVFGKQRGTR